MTNPPRPKKKSSPTATERYVKRWAAGQRAVFGKRLVPTTYIINGKKVIA